MIWRRVNGSSIFICTSQTSRELNIAFYREKDSSLIDLESRYGKSIERIALLEEELVNKAQLEEECQRVKDELRGKLRLPSFLYIFLWKLSLPPDLEEEMAILRSQATSHPPPSSYSRPLTPPGTLFHPPRPLTATPPPLDRETPSPFSTPRRRVPDAEDTTPTISLLKATPRPESTPTRIASPPALPNSKSFRASMASQQANPIARSARGLNLAHAAATTPKHLTPKSVREHRADTTVRNMKEMTERVKQLTIRLDSRRNLPTAGSSIPRMSPQSAGNAALTRSVTARKLTASALSQSQLGKTFCSPRPLEGSEDSSSSSTAPIPSLMASTRPSSRSGMRMSLGGAAINRTAIPVRPPSRMSSFSGTSTIPTPTTSRPTTPYSRSPTPSSASSSRPPWNGTLSTAQSSLAASTHRRRTSSTFGHKGPTPPPPTPVPLPPKRVLGTDGQSKLGLGSAPNGSSATGGKEGIARRASLALGRSMLRRPSNASSTSGAGS